MNTTILYGWQHSISPQVEITTDRIGEWSNCGSPSNKFFQGCKIDADTFGAAKSVQIRDADSGALHVLQPATVNHSGRKTLPYSFASPFTAHSVRDEPQDSVPWKNFGIEYIFESTPESVQTWKTQWTAHGLNGYHHIGRIEASYESSDVVALAVESFDGLSPTAIQLPSTGGVAQKVVLRPTPNKGQLFRYTATGAAFRIFLNDWTIWVAPWGRTTGYIPYRSLGGEFGDKARI